jgi:phosphohistidine swiveling domain-containing protein
VRRLVTRRATAVVAEVRRIEMAMTELELRMGAVAGRLISQGSGGWDQMFAGDRHVHLSIPMVEQWFGDDAARASLDAKWRERKAALEQREDRAPAACVHVPPIGAAATGPASVATEIRGAGLVSGVVQGTSAVVTRRDPNADAGSVVVLSDEAAEDARVVLDATGLVFLGRGACSAAATLARELGLPAVVCPDSRPGTLPHGRRIAVDSRQGLVRYG